MRKALIVMSTLLAAFATLAEVSVKDVTAKQRYPWNGLVDIVVTMAGTSDELGRCTFAATNCATGASVPIASVTQNGEDIGSGTTWTRKFIWNAAKDVGEVKIDDLALAVDIKELGGVQLWENGPYWAECNVGATKPEEYGYYFWWGDTVGYKRKGGTWTDGWYYSGVTWVSSAGTRMCSSPFSSSTCPTYGKSNAELQSVGYVDATGNLVAAHDAATTHLGAPWRMPSSAEFDALISNCDMQWTTRGGVYGRLVTGRGEHSSKSIFLPAAGGGYDSDLSAPDSCCDYWSSTPDSDNSSYAWFLYFYSSYILRDYCGRYCGLSVRPVRGFAMHSSTVAAIGVGVGAITQLKLDCRTGVRTAGEVEQIRFSPEWETTDAGARVEVSVSGVVVTNTTESGELLWKTEGNGEYTFTHEVFTNGVKVGETLSAQFEVTYFSQPPVISPASGTIFEDSLTVTIVCATEGMTIHYTTNGTKPTAESPVYVRKFRIFGKTTVRAIAIDDEGRRSVEATASYVNGQVKAPVVSVASEFTGSRTELTMSCGTAGATIYYTLDGSMPTAESQVYKGPIAITNDCTIKAMAMMEDHQDSKVSERSVTRKWGYGEALNWPNQEYQNRGVSEWCSDREVTYDGVESLRSGELGNCETNSFTTVFSGKGMVSFWWKASCEDSGGYYDYDRGEFEAEGKVVKIDGETEWRQVVHTFESEGEHLLIWRYIKDDTEFGGSDCVWVDNLEWKPEEALPNLGNAPTVDQVAKTMWGSADAKAYERIVTGKDYLAFCEWSGNLMATSREVMDSPYSWLSFALEQDTLIERAPTNGQMKVEAFVPSTTSGKFDFTVSIEDIAVGSNATAENMKQVFGLVVGAKLNELSADNVEVTFDTPVDGKVKFTAGPKDSSQKTFFMKVKMKP